MRAVRYLLEAKAAFLWANEANQDVFGSLLSNLCRAGGTLEPLELLAEWRPPARSWRLLEGLPRHGWDTEGWRLTHWEAQALLGYCRAIHRQFDLVDVDAFGCWPHLSDALETVRSGGFLYLTATGLSSWKPTRSLRVLGVRFGRCPPLETLLDHMCRALIWHVAAKADGLGLVAEPLFTIYRGQGDVYRCLFRVTRRFGESQLVPQSVGLCRACNSFVGPVEEQMVLSPLLASGRCGE